MRDRCQLSSFLHNLSVYGSGEYYNPRDYFRSLFEVAARVGKLRGRDFLFLNYYMIGDIAGGWNYIFRNISAMASSIIAKHLWLSARVVFSGDDSGGMLEREIAKMLDKYFVVIKNIISDALDFGRGFAYAEEKGDAIWVPAWRIFPFRNGMHDSYILDCADRYMVFSSGDFFGNDFAYSRVVRSYGRDRGGLYADTGMLFEDEVDDRISVLDFSILSGVLGCGENAKKEVDHLSKMICYSHKAQELEVLPSYLYDDSQYQMKSICPDTLYAAHDGISAAAEIRSFTEARGASGANFVDIAKRNVASCYFLDVLFDANGNPSGVMSEISARFHKVFIRDFLDNLFATKKFKKVFAKYSYRDIEYDVISNNTIDSLNSINTYLSGVGVAVKAAGAVTPSANVRVDADLLFRKIIQMIPKGVVLDDDEVEEKIREMQNAQTS